MAYSRSEMFESVSESLVDCIDYVGAERKLSVSDMKAYVKELTEQVETLTKIANCPAKDIKALSVEIMGADSE